MPLSGKTLPYRLWTLTAFAVVVAAFALFAPVEAAAQCALCKEAVRAGGEQTARTMNTAIIVLLIPPVTIFCSIFAVIFKYRNRPDEDAEGKEKDGRR